MAGLVGRWTRGLLHLLVGGACAALVAWLSFAFFRTLTGTSGPVRAGTAAVVALSLALVAVLLTAPPVRPAEVALARTLLQVPLTEPADTTSWQARSRGLVWAVAVIVLGGLSLLALLWCLPQGVWLVVAGLADGARADLPAPLAGLDGAVLVVLGLLVAAAGVLVQPLLVGALRALAPVVLGPTAADLLAQQEERRRELLRAHELARELHDSVGHALTAIGVQAEAGLRVADRDPDFARAALGRIAATTRRAVEELDEVLGALRRGAGATGSGGLAEIAAGSGDLAAGATAAGDLAEIATLLGEHGPLGGSAVVLEADGPVDARGARTAYRLVQEALTNARRHGDGTLRGHLAVRAGRVRVLLENPVAGPGGRQPGGRGVAGMRERVELADGRLRAGPVQVEGASWWRLEACFPAREGQR